MKRLYIVLISFIMMLPAVTACRQTGKTNLQLATTTSVQDSGLLPYLLPQFEKQNNCEVHVIAVGTGQALKLASNGDVDMVLVHAPDLEEKFISDGFGINRKTFMVNDFVILGPPSDPAGIRGMADAAGALEKIRSREALFISRGDSSGTHQKELNLWKTASIEPAGAWYMEVGQGMGAVLTMAGEKGAYTLSDRGTYLARSGQPDLEVLVEGDPNLLNHYSAIQVNPERYPKAKAELSRRLTEWLCSPEGQELIREYAVNGRHLFNPSCNSGE